jgi:hypothetical protein
MKNVEKSMLLRNSRLLARQAFIHGAITGFAAPLFLFANVPLGASSNPGSISEARRAVAYSMRSALSDMHDEATTSSQKSS